MRSNQVGVDETIEKMYNLFSQPLPDVYPRRTAGSHLLSWLAKGSENNRRNLKYDKSNNDLTERLQRLGQYRVGQT
jgi:hypothetical protein